MLGERVSETPRLSGDSAAAWIKQCEVIIRARMRNDPLLKELAESKGWRLVMSWHGE